MYEVQITDTGLPPWSFLAPIFSQYFPEVLKAHPVFLKRKSVTQLQPGLCFTLPMVRWTENSSCLAADCK